MKYVISTMSMPVAYCFYEHQQRNQVSATAANPVVGDVPLLRKKIFIHGGAGLPSLKSGFGERSSDQEGKPIWTADGMVTPVDDKDFEMLMQHPLFKKHLEGGRVKVVNHDITENYKAVRKEVVHMAADPFAPLTKDTFKKRYANQSKMKVKTGAFEDDVDSHRN